MNNQATSTGALPATLSISPGPNLTALGTGSYLATVQVSGSDGSVAYITVNLTVNGGAQTLSLSPATVTLTSAAGGLEVQQPVTVTQHQLGNAYGKCCRQRSFVLAVGHLGRPQCAGHRHGSGQSGWNFGAELRWHPQRDSGYDNSRDTSDL